MGPATPATAGSLVSVPTSELQVGDIVHCHGVRCRIDEPLKVSRAHPITDKGGACLFGPAVVISDWNNDRTDSLLRHFINDDGGTWTIQGNSLAHWWIEPRAL